MWRKVLKIKQYSIWFLLLLRNNLLVSISIHLNSSLSTIWWIPQSNSNKRELLFDKRNFVNSWTSWINVTGLIENLRSASNIPRNVSFNSWSIATWIFLIRIGKIIVRLGKFYLFIMKKRKKRWRTFGINKSRRNSKDYKKKRNRDNWNRN